MKIVSITFDAVLFETMSTGWVVVVIHKISINRVIYCRLDGKKNPLRSSHIYYVVKAIPMTEIKK